MARRASPINTPPTSETRSARFARDAADAIIAQCIAGTTPWQREVPAGAKILPVNALTNEPYRGFNRLWLLSQNRSDPRWLTYEQATREGAAVRKGERPIPCIKWLNSQDGVQRADTGAIMRDEHDRPILKASALRQPQAVSFYLYNAAQIDGLPPPMPSTTPSDSRFSRVEALLLAAGAKTSTGPGNAADRYDRAADRIMVAHALPVRTDTQACTALHELAHWTSHPDRMDRADAHSPYGSLRYANEELIAGVATLLLTQAFGVAYQPRADHTAYIESWIALLRNDPFVLHRAGRDADSILSAALTFERGRTTATWPSQQIDPQQVATHRDATAMLRALSQRAADITPFHQSAAEDELQAELAQIAIDLAAARAPTAALSRAKEHLADIERTEDETSGSAPSDDPERALDRVQADQDAALIAAYQSLDLDDLCGATGQALRDLGYFDALARQQARETALLHAGVFSFERARQASEDPDLPPTPYELPDHHQRTLLADWAFYAARRIGLDNTDARSARFLQQLHAQTDWVHHAGYREQPAYGAPSHHATAARAYALADYLAAKSPAHATLVSTIFDTDAASTHTLPRWYVRPGLRDGRTEAAIGEECAQRLSDLHLPDSFEPRTASPCRQATVELNTSPLDVSAFHQLQSGADYSAFAQHHLTEPTPVFAPSQKVRGRAQAVALSLPTPLPTHVRLFCVEPVAGFVSQTSHFTSSVAAADRTALASAENRLMLSYIDLPANAVTAFRVSQRGRAASYALPADLSQLRSPAGELYTSETDMAGPSSAQPPIKTYLAVPFSEKDQAVRLGARWDKAVRCWFAPSTLHLERGLSRWLPSPQNPTIDGSRPLVDPREEFAAKCRDMGLDLGGRPIGDGKFHRASVVSGPGYKADKKKDGKYTEQSATYRLHLDGIIPAGFIRNYKSGLQENWKYSGRIAELTPELRAAQIAQSLENQRARDAIRDQERERTLAALRDLFARCERAPADHPYFAKKGITPGDAAEVYIMREDPILLPPGASDAKKFGGKNRLLIAGTDPDGNLQTAQSISPNGNKLFAKGCSTHAAVHYIGKVDPNKPLIIVEGWATGWDLHQATGLPVAVAFNSGNLVPGADLLSQVHPTVPLIIAGDNDHQNDGQIDPKTGRSVVNVGKAKAKEAADLVNAYVMLPEFDGGHDGTDWNDLRTMVSEEEFQRQLTENLTLFERHRLQSQLGEDLGSELTLEQLKLAVLEEEHEIALDQEDLPDRAETQGEERDRGRETALEEEEELALDQ